ncbi:type II secretion system F family protein [Pelomonas aquatica]|jgi:tight adherence protein B|uniref:Pilus assembly protein n=1 Tax=Pelomonas aquatica TaxID=431058 RepID=A0A9X4LF84_9BURK|nr:type II secretion system F family protein [Pelomonas aquatica]MCY4755465.1 type II secretion system F family protein [Pelomonas aquatica]MDG0861669.1 pilus assembly protein [Pelomonas aquatica]
MSTSLVASLVAGVVALSIVLLVWSLASLVSRGMERYRRLFTERAHVDLRELFLFIDPARLYMLNVALILLLGALTWGLTGNALPALLVAAATAFGPRVVLRWLRRRRIEKLEQQLPDALQMLSGGLKAGVSLSQAVQQLVLEASAPISQEFDLVLREQRLGVSLDDALENLRQRVPLQSVTLTVSAMRIATETGGQLAETLERAAQTLRQKLAMEGKIRALTSQGKLQAWVVGALPLFLMLVLNKMEPAAMHLMFSTRMGWATLAVIGLFEFFGIVVIRKIVDIDV